MEQGQQLHGPHRHLFRSFYDAGTEQLCRKPPHGRTYQQVSSFRQGLPQHSLHGAPLCSCSLMALRRMTCCLPLTSSLITRLCLIWPLRTLCWLLRLRGSACAALHLFLQAGCQQSPSMQCIA